MTFIHRAVTTTVLFLVCSSAAHAAQTIVFFRHGEKPASGLGQITCQGLNRALALPDVLFNRYGPPKWAYAPDPTVKMTDAGGDYFYVRPLATIEPAAIRAGISVNTGYGYTDVAGLRSVLIKASKADDVIYVAWEHAWLVKIVESIMNAYGNGASVRPWISGDYDSLYVVRVVYANGRIQATLEIDTQGLNGRPTTCPS